MNSTVNSETDRNGLVLVGGATGSVGQLTDAATLTDAVAGVDAVVFTQGSSYGDQQAAEAVDYGAVENILAAVHGRPVRIALMTAIGITRRNATHDWKRRSERLVRASGNQYTIVRPGWFDYNDAERGPARADLTAITSL